MAKGFLLTLLAGVLNSSFPLPMRYMREWAWENIWSVWSVVALFAAPWLLAFVTVPNLGSVYREAGMKSILLCGVFGLFWGIAALLFGLSVQLVGISLTFAVTNGLSTVIGSWVPLVAQHPGVVFTSGGLIVSGGVIGVVAGVAACSWAGHVRSKQAGDGSLPLNQPKFWRRLAVTVASGVLIPCFNLAFAFGERITGAAVRGGSSPAASTNAVLGILLTAGFITNIGYCFYLLRKNRTARLFTIPKAGKYVLLGLVMGTLWISSMSLYGSSVSYFGTYGAVVGWPIFLAVITIVSSLLDVAYGDWSKRPLRIMGVGMALLIGAVGIISYGMFRLQHPS